MIDTHVHVASDRYIPRSFIESSLDNTLVGLQARGLPVKKSRLLDSYYRQMNDHNCDQLVKSMDAAGVTKTVLLLPDFTYALNDCEITIEEMLNEHVDIMQRHPDRFLTFFGVDPRWGKEGIDLFERAVQNGHCSGMKIYPPCGVGLSDELFYPYYEICSEKHLPVLFHNGPTAPVLSFEFANPYCVDKAARDFGSVNFIIAHAIAHFCVESASLCKYRPNVYMDISGYPTVNGGKIPTYIMECLFQSGLSHKILFGTDWPIYKSNFSYQQIIVMATGEEGFLKTLEQEDVDMILKSNLLRLLKNANY